MTGSFEAERITDRYADLADRSRDGRRRFVDGVFKHAIEATGKAYGRLPTGARDEALMLCLSLYDLRGV